MCGVYDLGTAEVPVLHGLPEVLVVRSHALEDDALASLIGLLHAEAQHERSGAALVMRHLVDLLFVHTVRAWTAAHGEASWLGAAADPEIGTALAAIHRAPATRWTVASLARRAGMSRAVFSRRFREATGDPPMTYVTRCRMAHAADRLQAGLRVNEVAAEVGYDNEFAFARAFKRTRGIPPGAVRTRRR